MAPLPMLIGNWIRSDRIRERKNRWKAFTHDVASVFPQKTGCVPYGTRRLQVWATRHGRKHAQHTRIYTATSFCSRTCRGPNCRRLVKGDTAVKRRRFRSNVTLPVSGKAVSEFAASHCFRRLPNKRLNRIRGRPLARTFSPTPLAFIAPVTDLATDSALVNPQ